MSLADSSASFLEAAMPTSSAAKIFLIASTIVCMMYIISFTSPSHLTHVLVSALAAAEHAFLHTVEAGTFRYENAGLAQRLSSLQIDVSLLREAALNDSLSNCAPLSQFFKFRRTLAILRCIQEVRALEIRIEILKEFQLRHLSHEAPAAVRTISMCRRV
ncbi:hypothetical protein B0H11DRAFT_2126144 [Mycena galericulata]|nr:hypothetical protein B0H11DRAFT_2126144 [Mycena galericulata]